MRAGYIYARRRFIKWTVIYEKFSSPIAVLCDTEVGMNNCYIPFMKKWVDNQINMCIMYNA